MMPGSTLDPQFVSLVVLILAGFGLACIFDFLRCCGKIFALPKRALLFVDLLYCLFSAFFVFYLLLQVNRGEVRFYAFFSLGLGLMTYYMFCSSFVYRLFFHGLTALRTVVIKFAKMFVKLQDFFKKCRISRNSNHTGQ